MGTKNSGGYSIEIVDLEIDKDKNVKVTVKENTLDDETVTMALTYPAVCLELSEYANSIEIIKQALFEQRKLDDKEILLIIKSVLSLSLNNLYILSQLCKFVNTLDI